MKEDFSDRDHAILSWTVFIFVMIFALGWASYGIYKVTNRDRANEDACYRAGGMIHKLNNKEGCFKVDITYTQVRF